MGLRENRNMQEEILQFWLEEIDPNQWRCFDPSFDALLKDRFLDILQQASAGELFAWRGTPRGRLAEVIVLDQFSRNIHRDTSAAFAQDPLALLLAQELVGGGHDKALPIAQQRFAYLPFMHSESLVIHAQAVLLFSQPGLETNLDFELRHQAIIERFGRYPHRNDILGRSTSAAETAFLSEPGSSF